MRDLEYSTLENDHTSKMTSRASPVEESIIPLFPVIEENRGVVKNTEESKASPFIQAPVNMINRTWAEKGKRRATWEVKAERMPSDRPTKGAIKLPEKPKAAIIKGVVLCSQCQCECEREVPAARAIIDQELIKRRVEEEHRNRVNILWAVERETSRNVFQRLGGFPT